MSEQRPLLPTIKLSRTLTQVALLALTVAAYGALAVWKERTVYHELGDIPAEIHAALTLVLGWLLVFRTNTAYNRWWEARTLWGGLVNACRNLAAKLAPM
jgi:putative membrane protein